MSHFDVDVTLIPEGMVWQWVTIEDLESYASFGWRPVASERVPGHPQRTQYRGKDVVTFEGMVLVELNKEPVAKATQAVIDAAVRLEAEAIEAMAKLASEVAVKTPTTKVSKTAKEKKDAEETTDGNREGASRESSEDRRTPSDAD